MKTNLNYTHPQSLLYLPGSHFSLAKKKSFIQAPVSSSRATERYFGLSRFLLFLALIHFFFLKNPVRAARVARLDRTRSQVCEEFFLLFFFLFTLCSLAPTRLNSTRRSPKKKLLWMISFKKKLTKWTRLFLPRMR